VTFKYDPFGRRIEKRVSATQNGQSLLNSYTYVYDREDVILEYLTRTINNGAPTHVVKKYVHGPGVDEPLAVAKGNNIYFYHADGVGSVVALTNWSGATVEGYTYETFGKVRDYSATDGANGLFATTYTRDKLGRVTTLTETISSQSDYFTIASNGAIDVVDIFFFNEFKQVPKALSITSPATTLTAIGSTAQLTVTATYPSTATADVTTGISSTTYLSTNPAIAAVSADGLVTATGTGYSATEGC